MTVDDKTNRRLDQLSYLCLAVFIGCLGYVIFESVNDTSKSSSNESILGLGDIQILRGIEMEDCPTLRAMIQQNPNHNDWVDDAIRGTYHDKCGQDPNAVPAPYSVTPNSNNINSLTRGDLNFSSIDRNHTFILDCVIFNIAKNQTQEQETELYHLMDIHNCDSMGDQVPTGHWNYYK